MSIYYVLRIQTLTLTQLFSPSVTDLSNSHKVPQIFTLKFKERELLEEQSRKRINHLNALTEKALNACRLWIQNLLRNGKSRCIWWGYLTIFFPRHYGWKHIQHIFRNSVVVQTLDQMVRKHSNKYLEAHNSETKAFPEASSDFRDPSFRLHVLPFALLHD